MSEEIIIDKHPCPVCGELKRELILTTIDRHYNIKGNWDIGKCTDCGLVQLTPMLTASELIKHYPSEDYYAYNISKHKQFLKTLFKKIFVRTLIVNDPEFNSAGKVLDYGCGTGWSLLKFKEKGWSCFGIEPSLIASKVGRDVLNLNIITGTFHTIGSEIEKNFNYIRANHSLEHDPDIDLTLKKFTEHIDPKGKILIGVPNIDSIPYKIFKKYWWYLGAPVHTYNFTPSHLEMLLNKHGLKVVKIRFNGNYSGILGSIKMYMSRNDENQNPQKGFIMNFPPFIILTQFIAIIFNLIKQGDAMEITAEKINNGI